MASMGSERGFDADEDFYEDDEPLDKIVAAFEHGEHGTTGRPVSVDTGGLAVEWHTATRPGVVTLRPKQLEPIRPVVLQIPA